MSDLIVIPSKDQIFLHDQVQSGFEWMTVTASLRQSPTGLRGDRLGLALCISSSFGAFSHEYYSIHSGPCTDQEAVARAFLADTVKNKVSFVKKVVGEDSDVGDFEASLTAMRQGLSDHLESLDPEGQDAQEVREAMLVFEEAVADISEDWGEAHQIAQLLETTGIWQIFPLTSFDHIKMKPSRRRAQASGMFDRLWCDYAKTLAPERPFPD